MRSTRRLAASVAAAVLVLFAASCSTSVPTIAQTFWQVNLVQDRSTGSLGERLSFFVHLTDSEGISDLGSIYLLNDQEQIYWHLDSSNWQHTDQDGELWVGSNFLQMPDGSRIPRGKYRVLVSNLAGERATDSIFVSAERLNPSKVVFPKLAQEGPNITLTSALSETAVWLYDAKGELVGSHAAGARPLALETLVKPQRPPASQLSAYAYGFDKDCGCGLVSGPYELHAKR